MLTWLPSLADLVNRQLFVSSGRLGSGAGISHSSRSLVILRPGVDDLHEVGAARGVVVREDASLLELPLAAPASLQPEVVEEEHHCFLQVVGLFDAGIAPEDLDPLLCEIVIHPRGLVEADTRPCGSSPAPPP